LRLVHTTVCRVSRPLARLEAFEQRESRLVARHAGHCLRCQAERAIEHRIRRTLSALGENVITAPAGLIPAVMSSLDAPLDRPEEEPRVNTEKVAIAAAVLGVAWVVAWSLSRRVKGA
jgi:hypothetical protein